MATSTEPNPIAIRQEGGPNFEVNSGIANYYTEVLTELTGRGAPEAPYIALAAASGGSHNQPQFNEPVDFAVGLARDVGKAADLIAEGSGVPMLGINSSDSGLRAGLTTPDSRLIVTQSPHFDFAYSAEIDSAVPVLQRGILHGRETEYHCDDPEKRFVIDPPGRVLTDGKDPARPTLKAEVDQVIDTVHHEGILAVGEKATGRLLDVLAKKELEDDSEAQEGFRDSLALLTLAYFREHGYQLAPSSSSFVRQAGHQAVSALVAGTAATTSKWQHEMQEQMKHMFQRLGGVDFRPEDFDTIVQGVLKRMEDDGTRDAFATTAGINGSTAEEAAKAQTAGFMTGLLGVKLG
ncbi:MAG TPA: hypothetical protein VFX79_03215 [Candidatus Saccharimonadales bacterium]|nr:hypothetical protein [Candidatus Saccharimonadales bacterium]